MKPLYARRSEKPQQTYPDYKSVRYGCFVKGKGGNGAYEGMVVVVALLSQEGVEGHQSAVMSENESLAFGVEDSKGDRIVLAMYKYIRVSKDQECAVIISTNQLEQRHDDNQVKKELLYVTIFDAFVAPCPCPQHETPLARLPLKIATVDANRIKVRKDYRHRL